MIIFPYNSGCGGGPLSGIPDRFPGWLSLIFLIIGAILFISTFVILPPQPYTLIAGGILYFIGGIIYCVFEK